MDPNQPTISTLGQLQNFEGVDLTTVDTDYPVLAATTMPWQIAEVKVQKNNAGDKDMLVLICKTAVPSKTVKGKDLPAGYQLTHYITLTPGDKRPADDIFRDVASLLDAVYGESARKSINLATFELANLVNATFVSRTSVQPEKDGNPEQARIGRFVKKAEGSN